MTQELKYDYETERDFGDKVIRYGAMMAEDDSPEILLIKVGQNGTIFGYENKYIRMAEDYRTRCGVSVFVCSNPFDGRDSIGQALDVIRGCCGKAGVDEGKKILYFGHSNGALAGAWYGHKYPEISRMMLVNMPILESHWDMTVNGMCAFRGDLISVYGENDPSYGMANLFLPTSVNHLLFHIIEYADHEFTGEHLETFMKLPDHLLEEKR